MAEIELEPENEEEEKEEKEEVLQTIRSYSSPPCARVQLPHVAPSPRNCVGAVCWRSAIGLPTQSVVFGEVGRCVGMRWQAGGGVGVLRTGPVAAGVRVYSSVGHL
jgi:hypothetical protein